MVCDPDIGRTRWLQLPHHRLHVLIGHRGREGGRQAGREGGRPAGREAKKVKVASGYLVGSGGGSCNCISWVVSSSPMLDVALTYNKIFENPSTNTGISKTWHQRGVSD